MKSLKRSLMDLKSLYIVLKSSWKDFQLKELVQKHRLLLRKTKVVKKRMQFSLVDLGWSKYNMLPSLLKKKECFHKDERNICIILSVITIKKQIWSLNN